MLTITSIDQIDGLPTDMAEEIADALQSSRETVVEYRNEKLGNGEKLHFAFFPRVCRGGVCAGGLTVWTDAMDMDDLEDRWENQERWCE